ncbi:excalibur calcium-binding domain-containing protein [Kocuria sp. CH-021]
MPVAPESAPVPASYARCSDVRTAGAAPVSAGQPGLGSRLGRGGDGVAYG